MEMWFAIVSFSCSINDLRILRCIDEGQCIITGPNQDIAIKLIKGMKGLFQTKVGITYANKETVLELNGCSIEAYPPNHLDAYRALDNPKFILLDEADFL